MTDMSTQQHSSDSTTQKETVRPLRANCWNEKRKKMFRRVLRLKKEALFTVGTCGVLCGAAYFAPPFDWSVVRNTLGRDAVPLTIIGANVAVFALWRVPRLVPVLERHFLSGVNRPVHTLVTSTFSHIGGLHLFFNMYALYSMKDEFSRFPGVFVPLYLAGGIFGSFVSVAWKAAIGTAGASLGASGSVMACVGFLAFLNSNLRWGVPFIPPEVFSMSGYHILGIITGVSVLGMVFRGRFLGGFDHAGHLGALWFGPAFLFGLAEVQKRKTKARINRFRQRS